MSQHCYRSKDRHGRPVLVLAGWDRRLQGFFLQIEPITEPTDECHRLFDHLCETDLRRFGVSASFTESFGEFRPVLDCMGIVLPSEMIAGVEADGVQNVGNRQVDWGGTKADSAPVEDGREHERRT